MPDCASSECYEGDDVKEMRVMDTATRIEQALSAQGFLRDGCHPGDVIACIARHVGPSQSKGIGSAHIKITINKDEILREIKEIREKTNKRKRDLEMADGINLAAFLSRHGWVKE